MGATLAWLTVIALVLVGIVLFYHLGVNLSSSISTAFHAVEHALGQPILP